MVDSSRYIRSSYVTFAKRNFYSESLNYIDEKVSLLISPYVKSFFDQFLSSNKFVTNGICIQLTKK